MAGSGSGNGDVGGRSSVRHADHIGYRSGLDDSTGALACLPFLVILLLQSKAGHEPVHQGTYVQPGPLCHKGDSLATVVLRLNQKMERSTGTNPTI